LDVRGFKSKIEEPTFCRAVHGELTDKNGSIPSKKQKRSNLKGCDRQTDIQSIVENNDS